VTVFDASVIVKCYLDEPGSEAASRALFGEGIARAPELVRVEVASAICRRAHLGQLNENDARERVGRWAEVLLQDVLWLTPDAELLAVATELSLDLKHPVADCLYLALAQQHRMPLLTADRKFRDKAIQVEPNIQLLAGCEGS
jgi:predicted nucleic acid-binding protein